MQIKRYEPKWRDDFVRLNRDWIEHYFRLEEADLHTLSAVEESILKPGGEIFFALDEAERPVGCVALIQHEAEGRWELAKMAVDPQSRGKGYGRRLGLSLMNYARAIGVERLYLEANTALEASVALYEKLGFKPVPGAKGHYDRCNLLMEADLTSFPPQAYLPDNDPQLRTALLLSGGVDSALALHRLCSQGVRPDVYYIKIGLEGEDLGCTAEEDIELSIVTACHYGLRLEVVDLQQAYADRVLTYVADCARRGFTPNPDVMCNRLIKFGAFEEQRGFAYDRIATGHYACMVRNEAERTLWMKTSPDPVKDQTDFLARLSRHQLSKLVCPIGHLTKDEVRRQALEAKLPSARRRDSQGICFLGKTNYNELLTRLLGRRKGPVIETATGRRVGEHEGHWFHTIGQRKGLGLGGGPWFVTGKDPVNNIVYVAHGYAPESAYCRSFVLADCRFLTADPFGGAVEAEILFKIRHTEIPRRGRLTRLDATTWRIDAAEAVQGVAPGQFGVVYTPDGQICAGCGEIAERLV